MIHTFNKLLTLVAITLFCSLTTLAADVVTVTITDGINQQSVKERIEQNVSLLLTSINNAREASSRTVDFSGIAMTESAKADVDKLWRNEQFVCSDKEIVERLLTTSAGYQLRNIPLVVFPNDKEAEQGYQEAVINFDRKGSIVSFFYTINPELYTKVRWDQMRDKRYEVSEVRRRMEILDYVEHFRTAYNQKDMKFLRQVFSDDALIITGRVVKVAKNELMPASNTIVYNKQSKQQYLNNLQKAFNASSYIRVNFDDITIVEHPTKERIYGVTVHQQWNTSRYSDEGYVFMVWDFRNAKHPQIHVRTWQPDFIDKQHGQKLNPNDVFTLGDFDL